MSETNERQQKIAAARAQLEKRRKELHQMVKLELGGKAFFIGVMMVLFTVVLILGIVKQDWTQIWMGIGFLIGIPILTYFVWWRCVGGKTMWRIYKETKPSNGSDMSSDEYS